MPDLIPIVPCRIGLAEVDSVDGRVLHAKLGMSRQYANWIRTWLRKAHLVEHRDYEVFNTLVKNPTGGRPSAEYALTVDAAKCIAMMSGGEQGDKIRAYFLAREQQAIALEQQLHPQVKNPAHQLLIDTIVRLDEVEQRAQAAEQRALVAETKADLALEDSHRMTLEEFICKNGLLRQFPRTQFATYARWLGQLCDEYGLPVPKSPVYGQSWDSEKAYPLSALTAWLRHEQRKPQQVRLVPAREEAP